MKIASIRCSMIALRKIAIAAPRRRACSGRQKRRPRTDNTACMGIATRHVQGAGSPAWAIRARSDNARHGRGMLRVTHKEKPRDAGPFHDTYPVSGDQEEIGRANV